VYTVGVRLPTLIVLAASAGCYQRPDVIPEGPDEIPLVAEGQCAPGREGEVACTLDGDTFDIGACGDEVGERFRMLGIDAPEIAHDEPADCWGDAAAFELERLLEGRTVTLTFDVDCVDVYERTLAYVWLRDADGDGDTAEEDGESVLVNEWMLEEGHARLYKEDWVDPLRLQQRLDDASARASARGLGLWGACPVEGG
jgi:micrococcal nuclease